jgi:hypothetical protein
MARPGYLQHIRIRHDRTHRSDQTGTVVLLPQGRDLVPDEARQRLDLSDLPIDREITLGVVTPRDPAPVVRRRRTDPNAWGFATLEPANETWSSTYRARSEAVESCAVEAIDGHDARRRFDVERWEQRRPTDN